MALVEFFSPDIILLGIVVSVVAITYPVDKLIHRIRIKRYISRIVKAIEEGDMDEAGR